jgi:four helix bundle protein
MTENGEKKYIPVKDLEVYQLSSELSRKAWEIYKVMDWQTKKIIGDQFITAIDSVGANIVEGYGRFHFLDRIKFYYNARASLAEGIEHWAEQMKDRGIIDEQQFSELKIIAKNLSVKLNNFISSNYKNKNES